MEKSPKYLIQLDIGKRKTDFKHINTFKCKASWGCAVPSSGQARLSLVEIEFDFWPYKIVFLMLI
jgi:hypothetical protein